MRAKISKNLDHPIKNLAAYYSAARIIRLRVYFIITTRLFTRLLPYFTSLLCLGPDLNVFANTVKPFY
jgi:hypothetical protein